MIISLGSSCQVSGNIKKFVNSFGKTNFFDYLITDFNTILYVLQCILINDSSFLNIENFSRENININRDNWIDHTIKIENIKLKMISVHDINKNKNYEEELLIFVEKYKRRYNRFIDIINTNKIVHFIHIFDFEFDINYKIPNEKQFLLFFDLIKKINDKNIYYLHILIPPKFKDIIYNNIHPNLIIHYLDDSNKYNDNNGWLWMNMQFNWYDIFNHIYQLNHQRV